MTDLQEIEPLNIRQVSGDSAPMSLLLEADPSEKKVRSYLAKSYCYIAEASGNVIGVCVLQPTKPATLELMNISVSPEMQARGVGSKLLKHAMSTARSLQASRLELGTGTFGYQLTFYQRAGFRVESIDRDFFLKHYAEPIFENGIQHKDMLRLAIDL